MESYSSCPTDSDYGVYLATGWQTIQNHTGTADYFNACGGSLTDWDNFSTNTAVVPHSGNGYIGLITYSPFDQREYAEIHLQTPMVADSIYSISVWVYGAVGDYSSDLFSDNIGIYVSVSEPVALNCGMCVGVYEIIPQVVCQGIIENEWTLISGEYTAQGGEQWLVLGNFVPNSIASTTPNGAAFMAASATVGYTFFDDADVHMLVSVPCIIDVDTSVVATSCNQPNGSFSVNSVIGGTAPFQFVLSDSLTSTTGIFENLPLGTYTLDVVDADSCIYTIVVEIPAQNPSSGVIDFDAEVKNVSCDLHNGEIQVQQVIGGVQPYMYSIDGILFSGNSTFKGLQEGEYSVTVEDGNGCLYSKQVEIKQNDAYESVFVPNCFTPDGDKVNNEWFVNVGCYSSLECHIFNRWGNLVKTITSTDQTWDGTLENGNKALQGVYVYVMHVTFNTGNQKLYNGHITLIR